MSIWNKILVGLVFVATIAFWYMAMRTLKTHQYWRNQARAYEFALQQEKDYHHAILEGGAIRPYGEQTQMLDQAVSSTIDKGLIDLEAVQKRLGGLEAKETPGIRRIKMDLHKVLVDRGRAWYDCTPVVVKDQAGEATGEVKVTTDRPDPHGILDKTILYIFEDTDLVQEGGQATGGRYIGEFKVNGVDQRELSLVPTMKLSPRELERLKQSAGPWTLYEIMPSDSHEVFAELEDEQLEKLLPADGLQEYLADGAEFTWKDIEEASLEGTLVNEDGKEMIDADGNRLEGKGKFVRQLHDYKVLFTGYTLQREVLLDKIASVQRDHDYTKGASDDAEVQKEFRESEKVKLVAELEEIAAEREAWVGHVQVLEGKVAAMNAEIQRMIASNKATAAQIAKAQLDAARQIDARTRGMAQTEPRPTD